MRMVLFTSGSLDVPELLVKLADIIFSGEVGLQSFVRDTSE